MSLMEVKGKQGSSRKTGLLYGKRRSKQSFFLLLESTSETRSPTGNQVSLGPREDAATQHFPDEATD